MIRVRIRDIQEDFINFAEALEYGERSGSYLEKRANLICNAMQSVSCENYVYIDFKTMAAFDEWLMNQ